MAWLINGWAVTKYRQWAVIFIGPGVEELLKTSLALLFGAPILLSHIAFGLAEAGWELASYRRGTVAALFALLSHGIYGWITEILAAIGITLALVTSCALHMLWNYWVLQRSKSC
jgi:hypothetical protein